VPAPKSNLKIELESRCLEKSWGQVSKAGTGSGRPDQSYLLLCQMLSETSVHLNGISGKRAGRSAGFACGL